jgi:transaldolase/glucose-6-phosphate isomerase
VGARHARGRRPPWLIGHCRSHPRRARLDQRTLVIVASKSGGTLGTLSHFHYFHALQPGGAHYVAITDPGTGLANLARRHAFRRTFLNDPEIGWRYSALSCFGLVPAVLAGIDVEAFLDGAKVRRTELREPAG